MKTANFTTDFYKRLFDAIMDDACNVEFRGESDGYPNTFYLDGYEVEVTVYYNWSLHDESFDHAFGTWHDPYPYMEIASLYDIEEVTVRDETSGDEVGGFDRDAFMAQFEEPSCFIFRNGRRFKVNSGDKVLCFGKDAIFLAKNHVNGMLKVKTDKDTYYVESKYIKFY